MQSTNMYMCIKYIITHSNLLEVGFLQFLMPKVAPFVTLIHLQMKKLLWLMPPRECVES